MSLLWIVLLCVVGYLLVGLLFVWGTAACDELTEDEIGMTWAMWPIPAVFLVLTGLGHVLGCMSPQRIGRAVYAHGLAWGRRYRDPGNDPNVG
jgi:hypothetical protein